MYDFMREFFDTGIISPGYNSCFIMLIPKVENPTEIKDYRPISLIGLQYKIIVKLFANRLAKVVDYLVCLV